MDQKHNQLEEALRLGWEELELEPSKSLHGRMVHRLTTKDVLQLIAENGGPNGLNLSDADLSGTDLGREMIEGLTDRLGPERTRVWVNSSGKGINLKGAVLRRVNLKGANLRHADLEGADLRAANLQGAVLRSANLESSQLWNADLEDAILSEARLRRAKLWYANLRGADLSGLDLRGAVFGRQFSEKTYERNRALGGVYLFRAKIDGTYLTREQLDKSVVEEQMGEYQHARDVYLLLKNNFSSIGRYDDASWAYIKERQMEKTTYAPWRARQYFRGELLADSRNPPGRVCWFLLKYTLKWLLAWAAELSCGYGEKPLRTLVWAGVILLIFPLLFHWSGGVISEVGKMTWLDYFNYSFGAFTTMGFDHFRAVTPLAQVLTSMEALMGISLLALLMFALGNRISGT